MPIPKGELIREKGAIPKGEPVSSEEAGIPAYVPEELKTRDVPEGKTRGTLEAGVSIARESAAEPIAGLAGMTRLVGSYLKGEDDPLGQATTMINMVRNDIAGTGPDTEAGKAIKENLVKSPRLQSLMRQARSAGESTLSATGSPAAATAVQTGIEFIPALLGAQNRFTVRPRRGTQGEGSEIAPSQRGQPKDEIIEYPTSKKVRKQDIKRVNSFLKREGIDVRTKQGLFESITEVAENVQKPGFAESLRRISDSVIRAKKVEKDTEVALWKQAREGGEAYVGREQVVNFRKQLDEALEPYNIEDFSSANKLLKRFDKEVSDVPGMSAAKLSALHRWRKSINANMPSDKLSPEAAALRVMKRNLDNFVETQFATDMISGDPASVARWKAAIDKTTDIKERFEPDNIIRSFADNNATPEELRNFIFNASGVGAKNTAQRTIQRLKKILGPDSDEITALRQESLFDVMEPLMKESPDFEAFTQRYQKFIKKNPGVVKELFPENARESLRVLNSAAKSAEIRRNLIDKYGSWHRALADIGAVGMFGHNIAQAGLKVRLAKEIFDNMISTGETPIQLEIMRDFLGYDPTKSAFRTPAKRGAVTESVVQSQEDEEKTAREGMR